MAPKIKKEECIGCGACAAVCPQGVIEIKDGVAIVAHPDKCTSCGNCVESCPVSIISLK